MYKRRRLRQPEPPPTRDPQQAREHLLVSVALAPVPARLLPPDGGRLPPARGAKDGTMASRQNCLAIGA